MNKIKHIYILVIITFMLLFSSCYYSTNYSVKSEANDLSVFIMENITNKGINHNRTLYSDDGILIELYGSDDIHDALELTNICNRWLTDNQDSVVHRDSLSLSVEMYLDKPDDDDRDSMGYSFRIANNDVSFATSVEPEIDCIDINRSIDFCTSIFNGYNYRYIGLPSNTTIDDFHVFVEMSNLRCLIVNDGPFSVDRQRLEDKYAEICALYNTYDELQFGCYKV